jgi:transketolase C-terminal domain/subunit
MTIMFASHLQPNLTDSDIEKVPTRNGFGEGLLEAGKRDERVVGLCCDLTESTRIHHFAEAFPERFIQVGVAEQNLASVGSGMAAMGKIPFIASYAMFSAGRGWEQIRTTIGYNNVNVKIGKAEILCQRDEAHERKVGIVVTGSLLYNSLMAAKELNENGIGTSVLHMATIKPLDTDALEQLAAEHDALITIEEHQVTGGLGGAVTEHLSGVRPTKVARIGVQNEYGQSGEPDELIEHYGMGVRSIVETAKRLVS